VSLVLLIVEISRSSLDTSLLVKLPYTTDRHRTLPDNTQRSQETNINVLGGIRTLIPSMRAAADPRFRQRVQWNRHLLTQTYINFSYVIFVFFCHVVNGHLLVVMYNFVILVKFRMNC